MSRIRNIPSELLEIRKLQTVIPEDAYIYVDGNSGSPSNIFADTRWLPYLLKENRFVFDDASAGGGYIYNVLRMGELLEGSNIYSIEYNIGSSSMNPNQAIFSAGPYTVRKFDKVNAVNIKGLYAKEQWGSWMGDEISIQSNGACDIEVHFLGKFKGLGSNGVLIVKSAAKEERYKIGENEVKIGLATKGRNDVIFLKSSMPAVSPQSIGESTDSRRLSYMVGNIKVSNCSKD